MTEATVVLRRSSLGDVVLAGAITGPLAPVIFHTRAAWAGIAARLPGVVEVRPWSRASLPAAARQVIDLQASLESWHMSRAVRAPCRRVHPARLQRHLRATFQTAPPPSLIARYAVAAGVPIQPHPWIPLERTPEDLLLVAPGAAWATKRWPVRHWAALVARWPGTVCLLGGPEDGDRCRAVQAAAGRPVDVVCEAGFAATLAAMTRGRALVAGDTGLLHLGAACGLPVVGIFGPTHSADGHWCHPGLVVERPGLSCRPCSRFGRERCPRGHHACLEELPPNAVWAALQELLRVPRPAASMPPPDGGAAP